MDRPVRLYNPAVSFLVSMSVPEDASWRDARVTVA